jgi:signal transduction histidine kinase
METYAGAVSHDLKTPLVAMTGYVEMLRQLSAVNQQPAEYDELLAEILDSVETMRGLIDRHLEQATEPSTPSDHAPVDLATIVDGVLAPHVRYRRHAGEPVPVVTVDPLPAVLGDPAKLRQVMDNLLGNAIKYTLPGEAARVHISGRPVSDGQVLIEVADRGVGVPAGQHELIFHRFHRAHGDGYPGTGLGLSICQGIAQRYGGEIGCLPNAGGGTRFWLTLPGVDVDAATGPVSVGVPASRQPRN